MIDCPKCKQVKEALSEWPNPSLFRKIASILGFPLPTPPKMNMVEIKTDLLISPEALKDIRNWGLSDKEMDATA